MILPPFEVRIDCHDGQTFVYSDVVKIDVWEGFLRTEESDGSANHLSLSVIRRFDIAPQETDD